MRQRGFTIIEIIVVVSIISILAGIVTVAYIQQQNRANDSQANALVKIVTNAAERYHSKNLEYPTATTLLGAAPTNTAPTANQYNTIRTVLDSPVDALKDRQYKLFVCSGTCTLPNANGNYVYYLTKGSAAGSARTYSISDNSCVFTFPTTEYDGESYLIVYKQTESGNWKYFRSSNGNVSTSDTFWCAFM